MNKTQELEGRIFGRYKVESVSHFKYGVYYYNCTCSCGNRKVVSGLSLVKGVSKSCGCLSRELSKERNITHGMTNARLYKIYLKMKSRCYKKTDYHYKWYGARGITICDKWLQDFNAFSEWALQNGYNDSLSIDRIDNNKNYEPNNCRWVDCKTQCRNRRSNVLFTYRGETKTLVEWSEIKGISYDKLQQRYKRGIRNERLFFNGNLRNIVRQ